jgi:hypothetical protein
MLKQQKRETNILIKALFQAVNALTGRLDVKN